MRILLSINNDICDTTYNLSQSVNESVRIKQKFNFGWKFKADAGWKGKRILIDFERIMLTGDFWLNGEKTGGTGNDYPGFESNMTSVIKYDADNVMPVRASTGESGKPFGIPAAYPWKSSHSAPISEMETCNS